MTRRGETDLLAAQESDHSTTRGRRSAIPWRRLAKLMRPARGELAAMVALTAAGAVVGLVPAFALGSLVDDLARGASRAGAPLDAVLIVVAVIVEALAFAISDGFFASAVARLYRDLRVLMFAGAQRQPPRGGEQVAGLTSRFVSDAEAMQELIVSPLDTTAMAAFELVSALVALAVLDPLSVAVAAGVGLGGVALARATQAPVARAGEERQEALETMSESLAAELSARLDGQRAAGRFKSSASAVLRKEARLGWLESASRYSSSAVANLGPIAVVIVAALSSSFRAGTLLSLFLIAARAFSAIDDFVEVGLDVEIVRGAVKRCFELVDAREPDAVAEPLLEL